MSQLSQADRYLIDQIRCGNQESWLQVVDRYQGRLLAFARSQLSSEQEAEDLVQETFLGLLRNLDRFEYWTSLETCLFTILRRRLIDSFRRIGREGALGMCSLQSSSPDSFNLLDSSIIDNHSLSAKDSALETELRSIQENLLWQALNATIQQMQHELRFRDLQIFEMVFYAQLRNNDIAERIEMDEKQIALLKHRFIKRIAAALSSGAEVHDYLPDDTLLTRLWEEHRPSCPKRSTLGKMLLGVIPPDWMNYIHFHVDTLGCKACQANLQDLKTETQQRPARPLSSRILQSSIGFFRK
jgi:RNA polymerase sigma factor (sigma-70 family)